MVNADDLRPTASREGFYAVSSRTILARAVEVLYVQGLLLAHEPLTSRELALLSQGLTGLIDSAIDASSRPGTGDTL